MAIRRRRKTLTNLMSTMERRVTAVELRPINLLTSGQIAGAIADEDAPLDGGPDTIVGPNAPNQYKRVIEGWYYSGNLAGGKPRVDLYFSADPGLEKDNTIRISGINRLSHNNAAVVFDISNDYKVISADTPPWENRSSYSGTRDTPGEDVTNSVLFNPDTGTEYSTLKSLVVKRRISTVEATTTTAKIVFTSNNYFEVGQVVYIDMPSDSVYYGLDGLVKVKEAGSNFITFDFPSALSEPINESSVTEERYVYAVAQSAIRDGATWIDTSSDPDTVYVWKDIRWVLFNNQNVSKDSVKPGPVTDLEADDATDTPAGNAIGLSRVTLTWTAPDINEDGSPIDDLIGYTIWWRQYNTQEWEKADITGAETTWTKGGFEQGKPAYFRVFSRDSGGNLSSGENITHTTGVSAPQIATPKAPTVSTYLGTIKIAYDDLTANNLVQASTAKEIEVYFSGDDGFTPGPSTYYGKFPANAGSYIIIPGTELVKGSPLVDGTDYYIRIIVRDIYGNITAPSTQTTVRVKVSDIVTYDMIDVGTLTGQVIIGLDMRTSNNPSVSGGIIMNQQGITAYNPAGGQTFRINALNGAVSIGDYLGKSEAAGLYIAENVADGKFATKPSSGTYITDIQAGQIYLSQTAASTNYITKLSAGTLYLGKGDAASDINSNSTTIDGGKITTNSLNANRIGAGTIDASKIAVTNISASNIETGTLTGRTVRTNDVGKRIVISSTPSNYVEIHSSDGLQGYLTTSIANELILQRASGSGSGRVILTSSQAELSSGSNSVNVCGASKAYVLANSAQQVRIGCDAGSGALYLNFPTETNAFTGDRYMIINGGTGKVKYLSSFPNNLSDVRLKNLTNDNPLGIDFISKLNPVSFTWKPETKIADPGVKQFGLVAQEVEQALLDFGVSLDAQQIVSRYGDESYLDLVDSSSDDSQMRTVNYTALVPVLIKSTQQLLDRIKVLEEEVTILKERQSDAS